MSSIIYRRIQKGICLKEDSFIHQNIICIEFVVNSTEVLLRMHSLVHIFRIIKSKIMADKSNVLGKNEHSKCFAKRVIEFNCKPKALRSKCYFTLDRIFCRRQSLKLFDISYTLLYKFLFI